MSSILPVLSGLVECYLAVYVAKRAGRRSWWVLNIFGIILILFGFTAATRPAFNDMTSYMRVVGGTILFSSFVIGLSLLWIWPNRSKNRDQEG